MQNETATQTIATRAAILCNALIAAGYTITKSRKTIFGSIVIHGKSPTNQPFSHTVLKNRN